MDKTSQERNYQYFQVQLPNLLEDPLKRGKHAIVHNEAIQGLYDTFEAAYEVACAKFVSGFVVQQIIDESEIVGYLSPAVTL